MVKPCRRCGLDDARGRRVIRCAIVRRWFAVEVVLLATARRRGACERPTWDIADIVAGRFVAGALSRPTWDIADGRGAWRQPIAVPRRVVGTAWRHAARSAP